MDGNRWNALYPNLVGHAPSSLLRGGIGVQVSNDLIGAERTTMASLSYAYRRRLGGRAILAAGVQAGIVQKALRGDELISPEGVYSDGSIDHSDNLIPVVQQSGLAPNAALGLQVETRRWWAGVAVQNLLSPTVTWNTPTDEIKFRFARHYTAQLQYNVSLGSRLLLSPTVLLQSDLNQHQLQSLLMATWNNNIEAGVAFRGFNGQTTDAVAALAGLKVRKNLRLLYSYDITLSDLSQHSGGSHELSLRYQLPFASSRGGKTIYNPRFL